MCANRACAHLSSLSTQNEHATMRPLQGTSPCDWSVMSRLVGVRGLRDTEEVTVTLRDLPSIVAISAQSASHCWESLTQAAGHLCFPATLRNSTGRCGSVLCLIYLCTSEENSDLKHINTVRMKLTNGINCLLCQSSVITKHGS